MTIEKLATAPSSELLDPNHAGNIEIGVSNPKLVRLFTLLRTNFEFDNDTSKFKTPVWFWI